jgi:sialic acid synthase SpsE
VITPVSIGRHIVGPGRRCLVIAEAGVNHDGSGQKAAALVDAAADAGADAVKFQLFRASDLVTGDAPAAEYQERATGIDRQLALLRALELPLEAFARLRDRCRARGILFLATPFSIDDVDRLLTLDPPAIKIASTDLTNTPLLVRAVEAGRPMIVSTGAATEDELRRGVGRLRSLLGTGRLILLHCVSCYPAPVEAANLRAIETLQRTFDVPVGFSDHTTSVEIGAWAIACGASVVEKHITLDSSGAGPDHACSLTSERFARYVEGIRAAEAAMGDGHLGMHPLEGDVRRAARRSVVSLRAIPRGTVLSAAALTVKRPGVGIPAEELERLAGRSAAVDIPADTVITWEMVR